MAKRASSSPVWALIRSAATLTASLAVSQIAAAATTCRPSETEPGSGQSSQRQQDQSIGLYCAAEIEAAQAEAAAARSAAQAAEIAAQLGRAAAQRAELGHGTLLDGDASSYAGDDLFADDGHGLVVWPSGRVYAGAYNGATGRDGPGVSADPAGWRYAGQWREGAAVGPGVSAYDGVQDFAGRADHAGVIAYPDGVIYVGAVRGGHGAPALRDGPGVCFAADGRVVHDGMWRADLPA